MESSPELELSLAFKLVIDAELAASVAGVFLQAASVSEPRWLMNLTMIHVTLSAHFTQSTQIQKSTLERTKIDRVVEADFSKQQNLPLENMC